MSIVFLVLKDPGAFVSLNTMIALVLFFPLSSDPLRKAPASRLALWPLDRADYAVLRILTPWLNPLTWLLAAAALRRSLTLGLWAMLAGLFLAGFVIPSLTPRAGTTSWRYIPNFPGPLNQLIRKNLRETVSTLDFYAGLMISAGGTVFRALGLLPHEGLLPLTIVVMLAVSTNASNLFGLDGSGGLMRYRLLPLESWQILAAKDAAFLLASLLLTFPLSPAGGMAAALVALAQGHYASVRFPHREVRWRFCTSASFGSSIAQVVLMAMAAAGTVLGSPLVLAGCLGAYAWSTWRFGRYVRYAAVSE